MPDRAPAPPRHSAPPRAPRRSPNPAPPPRRATPATGVTAGTTLMLGASRRSSAPGATPVESPFAARRGGEPAVKLFGASSRDTLASEAHAALGAAARGEPARVRGHTVARIRRQGPAAVRRGVAKLQQGAAKRLPVTMPAAVTLAPPASGPGEPVAPQVAERLAESFSIDLASVRIHSGGAASSAAEALDARAFTVGNHIFLARGESSSDLGLIAHEVAHVVQQRAVTTIQKWTARGGDSHEREAHRASAAVLRGAPFEVTERTPPRAQRWGISDALDRFAGYANAIPGYRMFTIVLGVNPINMSPVTRSAANVMRAIVELIPGGALISKGLDAYGIFDKVGSWVERQIASLGMTGSSIKAAITEFLNSLSWSDVFDLGGVWERAKRIFTEPIGRIIDFATGLITGILEFIREAILKPIAALAEGTPFYPLLKAVLGKDPITGDDYPPTAENLIGGFMTLIGQQEVWENIQKGGAIGKAFAWFQSVIAGVKGFVSQIPTLFINALKSLQLADIVVLPQAFIKVGKVFASFVGDFMSWGLAQVLSLLQIIVEVVAPGVMPYITKAAGAFKTIIQNPIGFVGNLVKAGLQGLNQFASKFLTHLKNSLIKWLTGALGGAGIYIPQGLTFPEIIKFVLSVLGLTWAQLRVKLVKAIGEPAVAFLEAGFAIVKTLITEGPAAAWQQIKEGISNLQEMVMEQVTSFVTRKIVEETIKKLVTSLNPAGAFIQAVIAIYNTVMFFVERLKQIAEVAAAIIDSIAAIASGAIAAAANKVEQTMAGLLVLVISFLARLAGFGKVSAEIEKIVKRLRAPVDKAVDKVIAWIVAQAKKLGKLVAEAGVPQDPKERVKLGLAAAIKAVNALKGTKVTAGLINPLLTAIKTRYGLTKLVALEKSGKWWIESAINPVVTGPTNQPTGTPAPGAPGAPAPTGPLGTSQADAIDITWVKPAVGSYPQITLAPPADVAAARTGGVSRITHAVLSAIATKFTAGPGGVSKPGLAIGVSNPMSQTGPGFTFQAQAPASGNSQKDALNALIERWGYNRADGPGTPTDGDHVMEKQLGGPDATNNVWPLNSSINRSSGGTIRGEVSRIKQYLTTKTGKAVTSLAGIWLRLKF